MNKKVIAAGMAMVLALSLIHILSVGLAAVMGILYSNFDGQMKKELSKEAAYLSYGVEPVSYTHLDVYKRQTFDW